AILLEEDDKAILRTNVSDYFRGTILLEEDDKVKRNLTGHKSGAFKDPQTYIITRGVTKVNKTGDGSPAYDDDVGDAQGLVRQCRRRHWWTRVMVVLWSSLSGEMAVTLRKALGSERADSEGWWSGGAPVYGGVMGYGFCSSGSKNGRRFSPLFIA
ncbi:hypothetical protein U1Q18_039502, partial [Sarracenia purpurea var. burkii]